MAFNGELEHLPVVDLIQLLQTTRKSGVLSIRGDKGESRIVFSEGRIVSANYLNSRVRIGRVLVKTGVITEEDLDRALEAQKDAGENRRPLIATLIEMGRLKEEDAFNGLKNLVEMTVVELVGWTAGTFAFDTEPIVIGDQCLYRPESMDQEISIDAQMILMDALRIFDEMQRDGGSSELLFSQEELAAEASPEASSETTPSGAELTAADLGLSEIDKLEKKIPRVFKGIEALEPAEIHRQKLQGALKGFPAEKMEELVAYLLRFSDASGGKDGKAESMAQGIILFSRDEVLQHSINTLGTHEGILVFSTGEEGDLDPIINQCLSKVIIPLLILDGPDSSPEGITGEIMGGLRHRTKEKYPQVAILQLAPELEVESCMESYEDGVMAVLPRPSRGTREETYIEDAVRFLETFRFYIKEFFQGQGQQDLLALRGCIREIRELMAAPDISFALLRFVSGKFDRSITFIVRDDELVAERGIGVATEDQEGEAPLMKFTVPLTKRSIFSKVVEDGKVFYGKTADEVVKDHLFKVIGASRSTIALLLPVRCRGKTIAVIYGDFGQKEVSSMQIDTLEVVASQAGLALENSLYRKRLEDTSR